MKRVLVTGASGFVGGHLVPFLHKKGFEVWANFHRHRKKFPFLVRWLRADLTRFEEVAELVRKSRPHYIFHLAGQTIPQESWKNPGQGFQLNVAATLGLLESVLRFAPQSRLLLVSSAQVYGTSFLKKRSVCEDDVASPVNPYGGSKLLMEMAALNFVKDYGLSIVITRGTNQIGKGQPASGVFSDFCRQIALVERGKRSPVLKVGNLGVVRDFLHVDDAVRAYHLAATRGKRGEIYNVGSGRGIQVRAGLHFLSRHSRVPLKIQVIPSRFRRNDFPRTVASGAKLRKLGWRPQKSVGKALKELLEDWRQKV